MPRKDLRTNIKNRSGYTTVTYHGTRGRTFNATMVTRTSGTVGTLRLRSGAYKATLAGKAKASTAVEAADTWSLRTG
jgi:hypothetical protein